MPAGAPRDDTDGMQDLNRLADELTAIGQRLVAVSAQLRAGQPAYPAAPPQYPAAPSGYPAGPPLYQQAPPPPWVAPQPYVQAPMPPGRPVTPPPASWPPPPRPGLLDREGASGRLLAWVGGTVTLLGVVLLMVLAVQRGWLGPVPRVITGAVLGLVMIGLAVRVHRLTGGRTGALALMATGTAALYLDVIAATTLYDLLALPAGLVVGLAVAAGGLVFADRWREEVLAVTAVAGAALFALALTGLTAPELVAFVLVLQVAATPVQLRRGWAGLALTGALPPVLAGFLCGIIAAIEGHSATTVMAAVAVAIVGGAVAVLGTVVGERLPRGVSAAMLALAPGPALLVATLLGRWPATLLAAAVAAVAAAMWAVRRLDRDLRAVAGAIGAVAAFEATVLAFDGFGLTIALLAEAIVLAVAAWRLGRDGVLVAAGCFLLTGGLYALAGDLPPESLLLHGPLVDGGRPGLTSALGVSVLLMLAAAGWALAAHRRERLGSAEWPLWVIIIGVVLYGEVGAILSTSQLIVATDGGFVAGHAAVTVSWTVAALVLLVRGIRSKPLRATGFGLVGAALFKLVAFDLASLDGVARVVTFLGAGLVLLAAGTLYARVVAAAEGTEDGSERGTEDGSKDGTQTGNGAPAGGGSGA